MPSLGWPGKIARKLARRPLLVVSTASIALKLGREAYRVRKGEIDGPEFRARAAQHVGAIGGGALGATAGAIAGSVLPGLGTLLGGFVGGILGEMGGSRAGRAAAEVIEERFGGIFDKPDSFQSPEV